MNSFKISLNPLTFIKVYENQLKAGRALRFLLISSDFNCGILKKICLGSRAGVIYIYIYLLCSLNSVYTGGFWRSVLRAGWRVNRTVASSAGMLSLTQYTTFSKSDCEKCIHGGRLHHHFYQS